MNIFFLDLDQTKSAHYLVDKHVVKMIVESMQMLSTAHRILDGTNTTVSFNAGHKIITKNVNLLAGESAEIVIKDSKYVLEIKNSKCYKQSHYNHPCNIWIRKNKSNYDWLVKYTQEMLVEYSKRYNKSHSCEKLFEFLKNSPKNIALGELTNPPLAMPEKYKSSDTVMSYRDFYVVEKLGFAKWKHNIIPNWFWQHLEKFKSHIDLSTLDAHKIDSRILEFLK